MHVVSWHSIHSPEAAIHFAGSLRAALALQATEYARTHSLPHCESYGNSGICFEPVGDCAHGNFLPASYQAILANPQWKRRLDKVHTHYRRSLPTTERGRWRELDSCMSSDALLMNVFCYPRICARNGFLRALGAEDAASPVFGVPAHVPLVNGLVDRTEIDMRLGGLLVEAKLTEGSFQRTTEEVLLRYRDFLEVFDVDELPRTGKYFRSYQIIRNVLAAYASKRGFCVLLDARRPDLQEQFYAILKCIRPVDLRIACRVLAWQEMAGFLPAKVREFLSEKYAIV